MKRSQGRTVRQSACMSVGVLVRPRGEDLFVESEDLFVRRRLRSDFSRFDPRLEPTFATLLVPQSEDPPFFFCSSSVRGGDRAAL